MDCQIQQLWRECFWIKLESTGITVHLWLAKHIFPIPKDKSHWYICGFHTCFSKTQGKRIFPQNAEALWYFEIMISHMLCWLWLLNGEFWKCCANSDQRKLGSEISSWDGRVKWLFWKTLKKDWQGSDYSLWCFKDKFKNFKSSRRREQEYCKLFLLPNKISFNFIFYEKDNRYK